MILGHLVPGNGLFMDTNGFEVFHVIDGFEVFLRLLFLHLASHDRPEAA